MRRYASTPHGSHTNFGEPRGRRPPESRVSNGHERTPPARGRTRGQLMSATGPGVPHLGDNHSDEYGPLRDSGASGTGHVAAQGIIVLTRRRVRASRQLVRIRSASSSPSTRSTCRDLVRTATIAIECASSASVLRFGRCRRAGSGQRAWPGRPLHARRPRVAVGAGDGRRRWRLRPPRPDQPGLHTPPHRGIAGLVGGDSSHQPSSKTSTSTATTPHWLPSARQFRPLLNPARDSIGLTA
jgi:hypothetical protein